MNEFDRLNPKLAAWLDAMPNEAPDRVSDGIMSGIATPRTKIAKPSSNVPPVESTQSHR